VTDVLAASQSGWPLSLRKLDHATPQSFLLGASSVYPLCFEPCSTVDLWRRWRAFAGHAKRPDLCSRSCPIPATPVVLAFPLHLAYQWRELIPVFATHARTPLVAGPSCFCTQLFLNPSALESEPELASSGCWSFGQPQSPQTLQPTRRPNRIARRSGPGWSCIPARHLAVVCAPGRQPAQPDIPMMASAIARETACAVFSGFRG